MDPRALAQAEQLRAEIAASAYRKVQTFARALNEITPTNYTTFYDRVNGTRELPLKVLLPALDLLGIDYETFIQRSMDRYRQEARPD